MEIKLMKYCLYALVLVLVTTDCKKENAFLPGLVRGYTVSDSRQSPGYALQVIKGDSIVLEQYEGIEGLASREPISEKSLFNIGSISKTFVAYAILHLAHEGRIHLNDSLLKYFPDFNNPKNENPYKIMAGTRDGAMSCLIGIAARKSIALNRSVRIDELTDLNPSANRM